MDYRNVSPLVHADLQLQHIEQFANVGLLFRTLDAAVRTAYRRCTEFTVRMLQSCCYCEQQPICVRMYCRTSTFNFSEPTGH